MSHGASHGRQALYVCEGMHTHSTLPYHRTLSSTSRGVASRNSATSAITLYFVSPSCCCCCCCVGCQSLLHSSSVPTNLACLRLFQTAQSAHITQRTPSRPRSVRCSIVATFRLCALSTACVDLARGGYGLPLSRCTCCFVGVCGCVPCLAHDS